MLAWLGGKRRLLDASKRHFTGIRRPLRQPNDKGLHEQSTAEPFEFVTPAPATAAAPKRARFNTTAGVDIMLCSGLSGAGSSTPTSALKDCPEQAAQPTCSPRGLCTRQAAEQRSDEPPSATVTLEVCQQVTSPPATAAADIHMPASRAQRTSLLSSTHHASAGAAAVPAAAAHSPSSHSLLLQLDGNACIPSNLGAQTACANFSTVPCALDQITLRPANASISLSPLQEQQAASTVFVGSTTNDRRRLPADVSSKAAGMAAAGASTTQSSSGSSQYRTAMAGQHQGLQDKQIISLDLLFLGGAMPGK